MQFQEHPSIGHKDGQTRKQTDMTKLIVAFAILQSRLKYAGLS
jgi:hypothetical protein